MTSDIDKFSSAVSELYANMFKPVLDVILFTQRLGSIIGWQGPFIMYSYFFISAVIKKQIMPSFGKVESSLLSFNLVNIPYPSN